MDSHQQAALLKMFDAQRLHPHLPEHALFIKGEIAKLEVTDPSAAANFKRFYDMKLDEYNAANAPLEETVEAPIEVPVVEEVVIVKKKGRPSKKK